jgi:cobalt-zinc-cadmium efflux system membrane fusion protein
MNKLTQPMRRWLIAAAVGALLLVGFVALWLNGKRPEPIHTITSTTAAAPVTTAGIVELTPTQLEAIKLERIELHPFAIEKSAVGSIDYNENASVQVFPPYQGKIIQAFANVGDSIEKGQPLYTVDSPDLLQAESTLIGAVATFDRTRKELGRVKDLKGPNGISEREIEQATSDQDTAEGALKAARDTVRLFGKTDTEIDEICKTHRMDSALIVRSPVEGRVTARNAQPGLLIQPSATSAPYAVADLATKWMVANVPESDSPLLRVGQSVVASVPAYPGRTFEGKITVVGVAIDPNTHRVMVRSAIEDPRGELRPGMLANFVIRVQDTAPSVAIPMSGVVRNGDGTMAAWVTTDRRHFAQRLVKVGLENDGEYQVLSGLEPGDLAVTDGAVFLSNLLDAPPTD